MFPGIVIMTGSFGDQAMYGVIIFFLVCVVLMMIGVIMVSK
jgi:hypothetical protein